MLRTRCSAPFAAAAIFVMLMLEVFVARIAFEGVISASSENILVFSEGISYFMLIQVIYVAYGGARTGTASITKSDSERDESCVHVETRSLIFCASSLAKRPLSTLFCSNVSAGRVSFSKWNIAGNKTD